MDKRKELIQQYKMTERPMGIYQIRNLVNENVFIGKSKNIDGSFNSIRFQLKGNLHKNKKLQKMWNELGEDKFIFETLQQFEPSKEPEKDIDFELKNLETLWLNKLSPHVEKE